MSLADLGYRFTYLAGRYTWTHPAQVTAEQTDCTEMSDAEFEAFVEAHL